VLLFFLALLTVGLIAFKDYGISWDEPARLRNGIKALYSVVTLRPQPTREGQFDWAYGPAFNVVLALVGPVLEAVDSVGLHIENRDRNAWLIQHLLTFLLFYVAVWFFYRLVSERFRSWRMGLLGALMLVLSPRILADSFYNPKDLPLMSMAIVCLYTLLRYLDRPTVGRAAIHALACALLIDIRIVGILAPALTILFGFVDLLRRRFSRVGLGRAVISLAVFALFAAVFTVVFWPALWRDPVRNLVRAFHIMSRYSGDFFSAVLYMGRMMSATDLPWHYVPVWIVITTPLSYSLLFLAGVVALPWNLALAPAVQDRANGDARPTPSSYSARVHTALDRIWEFRADFLCLLWFLAPLMAVIVLRSVLYDGWRQLFFIYPAFLLSSLAGFRFLWDTIAMGSRTTRRVGRALIAGLLALDLLAVTGFMIRYHPHENVYFNILAGRDMSVVRKKFDMDYWGLSYRQLLEHIMQTDTSSTVRVGMAQVHGMDNAVFLSPDQARRLVYDPSSGAEHYFLSEYRGHPEEYGFLSLYYAIWVNGGKIAVAYRVGANETDSVSAKPEHVVNEQRQPARVGPSR
jgi:hypothetical protein